MNELIEDQKKHMYNNRKQKLITQCLRDNIIEKYFEMGLGVEKVRNHLVRYYTQWFQNIQNIFFCLKSFFAQNFPNLSNVQR